MHTICDVCGIYSTCFTTTNISVKAMNNDPERKVLNKTPMSYLGEPGECWGSGVVFSF